MPSVEKESNESKEISKGNVLLLGMVYAHHAVNPKRGQEFRDRVRCEAVQSLGYQVYSLDNKHDDANINEHCTANFADQRRMFKAMKSKWGDNKPHFQHVILDYFFSPIGWARERWSAPFFTDTLPALLQEDFLTSDGKIWLPNLQCITESLSDAHDILMKHFKIRLASSADMHANPLYSATNLVERELLSCPDALTNETQMRPLLEHSIYPFYVLERVGENEKGGFLGPLDDPITPVVAKRSRRCASSNSTEDHPRAPPKKKSINRAMKVKDEDYQVV
eukprot:gene646-701_t